MTTIIQTSAEDVDMQIEGTTALVTGANRGIGKAIAQALLDRGAAKVYAGVRNLATVSAADPRLVAGAARRHRRRPGHGRRRRSSPTSSWSSTTRASPARRPR